MQFFQQFVFEDVLAEQLMIVSVFYFGVIGGMLDFRINTYAVSGYFAFSQQSLRPVSIFEKGRCIQRRRWVFAKSMLIQWEGFGPYFFHSYGLIAEFLRSIHRLSVWVFLSWYVTPKKGRWLCQVHYRN